MEFVVQLFRALANRTRIKILRLLVVLGEINVSTITKALRLRQPCVSAHLPTLAAAGLIWRRRSGRVVFYRLAERPRHKLVEAALRELRRVFGKLSERNPKRLADAGQPDSPANSDDALFACFTAFTHPRRLQIIRYLAARGATRLPELATRLSMSPRACLRHLAKLDRRGYLIRVPCAPREVRYALANGPGPLQKRLMRALRVHLAGPRD